MCMWQIFMTCKNLRVVDLTNTKLEAPGVGFFITQRIASTQIEELILGADPQAAQLIAPVVISSPNLRVLDAESVRSCARERVSGCVRRTPGC